MITSIVVSPLDLYLDEKNPRFRITTNPTQAEIRFYMLEHEKTLRLVNKIVDMGTIMPGERIVIFEEKGKMIVLEGNRRTTAYQMLLDRSLIPDKYKARVHEASPKLLTELTQVSVDVLNNREEAMVFLAARHIEGVERWSSYSKWRISYEYMRAGMTIDQIVDQLALSKSDIVKNIKSYRLLLRVLENSKWTKSESEKINPLTLKPDQLLRLFFARDTVPELGLRYDVEYAAHSTKMSDQELDEVIYRLARMAFIDGTIDTRTTFKSVCDIVAPFLKHEPEGTTNCGGNPDDKDTPNGSPYPKPAPATRDDFNFGNGKPQHESDNSNGDVSVNTPPQQHNGDSSPDPTNPIKNRPRTPYFFEGLDTTHLNMDNIDAHGITRIAGELYKFSKNRLVAQYPLSSSFLTRAIVEQSLIYYAKMHFIQNTQIYIYFRISDSSGDPFKLGKIIDQYRKNINNYIQNERAANYFLALFKPGDYKTDPLNWVIHSPESFTMDADKICNIASGGLLYLINFLLTP